METKHFQDKQILLKEELRKIEEKEKKEFSMKLQKDVEDYNQQEEMRKKERKDRNRAHLASMLKQKS